MWFFPAGSEVVSNTKFRGAVKSVQRNKASSGLVRSWTI